MKTYDLHEIEYQRMTKEGIASWFERTNAWEIAPDDLRFLEDTLAQPWAPSKGRAIEIGCGTGPLIRWVCNKGFKGTGIDVSKTAIRMAKSASKSLPITYRVGDICSSFSTKTTQYDLCVDGRSLHCITAPHDRRVALANIRKLLTPGGVLVVMSMCRPVDRRAFARLYKAHKIIDDTLIMPWEGKAPDDALEVDGSTYAPMRHVPHWRRLLTELRQAGLCPMLMRLNHSTRDEPVSSLNVALTSD